jgi:hypothetical protein
MKLRIVPCDLDEANSFVLQHHRHHLPVRGCKFSMAIADGDRVVGVAIAGRPVARMLQDGFTLEVTRLASDGTRNACSALYAACWRAARAMGYRRMVTYILDNEPGVTLRAAGWREVGRAGGAWSRKGRPRVDKSPTQGKIRFEVSG